MESFNVGSTEARTISTATAGDIKGWDANALAIASLVSTGASHKEGYSDNKYSSKSCVANAAVADYNVVYGRMVSSGTYSTL